MAFSRKMIIIIDYLLEWMCSLVCFRPGKPILLQYAPPLGITDVTWSLKTMTLRLLACGVSRATPHMFTMPMVEHGGTSFGNSSRATGPLLFLFHAWFQWRQVHLFKILQVFQGPFDPFRTTLGWLVPLTGTSSDQLLEEWHLQLHPR